MCFRWPNAKNDLGCFVNGRFVKPSPQDEIIAWSILVPEMQQIRPLPSRSQVQDASDSSQVWDRDARPESRDAGFESKSAPPGLESTIFELLDLH